MRIHRLGLVALLAAAAVFSSCGKDEQEAAKFERADHETFVRDMSEMASFTLGNGITVYVQEERTNHQVAVEAVYRAGLLEDPKGMPELAHAAEHMTIHCASGDFKAEESVDLITSKRGMIAAESVPYFAHVDYVVASDDLETVLKVESQRLRSIQCDEEVFAAQMENVVKEFEKAVPNPKISLSKYGFMALNQIGFHGERRISFSDSWKKITIADAEAFHDRCFRPDDMVLVVIGHVVTADVEALVRKYFEPVPRRTEVEQPRFNVSSDIQATWDADAESFFLVAPGPYADFKERLILTMFGAYVHQVFMTTQEVYGKCRSVYATNQVYRVDTLPFLVYVEVGKGYTSDDLAPVLLGVLDQAVAGVDQSRVDAIKGAVRSFQTSTMLKPDVADYPLSHYQVIGQEALNVAMKHELREGRSPEEFVAAIDAITLEDMQGVLARYLDRSNIKRITLKPRI